MARRFTLVRSLSILVLLLVVGGGGFLYMRRGARRDADKYRTQPVDRGDVVMTVTATGTISAVTTVQVGSQVSGIVARLYADFNSPVKAGQLLAELDPTPFEAQVEQRRADLTQAQVQSRNAGIMAARQDRLLAEGLAPQADVDSARANADAAKAQVDQAQAALRQAQTNLRYTKIVSPIDGVVVDRKYDIGQTVAASFQAPTLFTIAQDLTKMQVLADVDQSDIGRVSVGQTARFTVDAYPEEEFRGRIAQIRLNATVNQNVITYPVILEVPNPEQKLRPQMTANVTVEVARKADVLRVANAALRFRPTDQPAAGAGRPGTGARDGAMAATPSSAGTGPPRGAGRGPGGPVAGAAAALGSGEREIPGAGRQTVYVEEGGRLRAITLRAGITDGRYTEILEGDLKPGDPVVVGQATSKVDGTARPPGGGRMF